MSMHNHPWIAIIVTSAVIHTIQHRVIRAIRMAGIKSHFSAFLLPSIQNVSFMVFFFVPSIVFSEIDPFIESDVVQVLQNEIYIDHGFNVGLTAGMVGTIRRHQTEIGRAEILEVSRRSARLKINYLRPTYFPRVGDGLLIIMSPSGTKKSAEPASKKPEKEKISQDDFVPLLAPEPKPVEAKSSNVSHGRLRMRYLNRQSPQRDYVYDLLRLNTEGTIERMLGSFWSFSWLGDVYYKDGPAYRFSPQYQQPDFNVFNATLERRFASGGFLRLGRFLPWGLSSLGYVDGVQSEFKFNQNFSFGGSAGYRPNHNDLSFNTNEPFYSPSVSLEAGQIRRVYYSGTLAFLQTFFNGHVDRDAFLLDQQFDLGPKLSFNTSTEVDFGVTPSTTDANSPRFTRLNGSLTIPLFPSLSFRGGFDRYQRPDTLAERFYLVSVEDSLFTDVTNRSWVGTHIRTIWNLELDHESSFIKSRHENSRHRWRDTLSRRGIPYMKEGRMGVTAYNYYESKIENYSGLAFVNLPFAHGKWNTNANYSVQVKDNENGQKEFNSVDYSFRIDARPNRTWVFSLDYIHTYEEFGKSDLLDLGIDFRW